MTRLVDIELLMARHREMLAYQEKIKPFTPTMRELKAVWNLQSTNSVRGVLGNLAERGLVKTRVRGKIYDVYYAVEPSTEREEGEGYGIFE